MQPPPPPPHHAPGLYPYPFMPYAAGPRGYMPPPLPGMVPHPWPAPPAFLPMPLSGPPGAPGAFSSPRSQYMGAPGMHPAGYYGGAGYGPGPCLKGPPGWQGQGVMTGPQGPVSRGSSSNSSEFARGKGVAQPVLNQQQRGSTSSQTGQRPVGAVGGAGGFNNPQGPQQPPPPPPAAAHPRHKYQQPPQQQQAPQPPALAAPAQARGPAGGSSSGMAPTAGASQCNAPGSPAPGAVTNTAAAAAGPASPPAASPFESALDMAVVAVSREADSGGGLLPGMEASSVSSTGATVGQHSSTRDTGANHCCGLFHLSYFNM